MRGLLGIIKADFLERYRKFSFLCIAFLTIVTAFWAVPFPNAKFVSSTIVFEPDIFVQGGNVSWIPMSIVLWEGQFFALFMFGFVFLSLDSDRRQGILQIIWTSGVGKWTYIIGKYIVNLLLAFSIWLTIPLGAVLMAVIQFPGESISAYAFFSPFLALCPGLFFSSAVPILFEALPVLNRSYGRTISIAVFVVMFALAIPTGLTYNDKLDFGGYVWGFNSAVTWIERQLGRFPGNMYRNALSRVHLDVGDTPLQQVYFEGLVVEPSFIMQALLLIGLSGFIIFIAALVFPSRERPSITREKEGGGRGRQSMPWMPGRFASEVCLLLRGRPIGWWAFILLIWFSCWILEYDMVKYTLWAVCLSGCVIVYSDIGCREHQNGVLPLLGTIHNAPVRQLFFHWLSGCAFSVAALLPIAVRMLLNGEAKEAMFCGAWFLLAPSAAALLGELTKTARTFELFYLIACFILLNTLSRDADLFWSISRASIVLMYLASIILVFAALGSRKRNVRRSCSG